MAQRQAEVTALVVGATKHHEMSTDMLIGLDPGPMARLEVVKVQAETPSVVFQRVAEGESLKAIAKSWQVPAGRFTEWFSTTHADLYDAALKVRADQLAHEALTISDEQAEVEKEDGSTYDPQVPRDKLRVDTRLKLAGKWDRERYGDKTEVRHSGLMPTLVIEIAGEVRKEPRVIEADPLPAPEHELI